MMTAWGNARRNARRTARGNACVVSPPAWPGNRDVRIGIVAADLACLKPCRNCLSAALRRHAEERAGPAGGLGAAGYEAPTATIERANAAWRGGGKPPRADSTFSPPRGKGLPIVSEAIGVPAERNRGGPFRKLAATNRRPRTMSEI